ncbi:hypothetical protein SKAU_G00255840 [Synaphobranchus kaupii]|uniref:Uncharacterized protein n=1 Tax=Synaphobranchus kaupii TaxID=118154 RepID=A0A9Q1F3W2_SYNKA|nr:hypothetical protein SKAU_G00255840 [Synaphobranchus kaupii]
MEGCRTLELELLQYLFSLRQAEMICHAGYDRSKLHYSVVISQSLPLCFFCKRNSDIPVASLDAYRKRNGFVLAAAEEVEGTVHTSTSGGGEEGRGGGGGGGGSALAPGGRGRARAIHQSPGNVRTPRAVALDALQRRSAFKSGAPRTTRHPLRQGWRQAVTKQHSAPQDKPSRPMMTGMWMRMEGRLAQTERMTDHASAQARSSRKPRYRREIVSLVPTAEIAPLPFTLNMAVAMVQAAPWQRSTDTISLWYLEVLMFVRGMMG